VSKHLDKIIISEAELAPFIKQQDEAGKAAGLLRQQRIVWPLLRQGQDSLQSVKTRVFDVEGFQIKVQFNPGRMTSTAAKVDPHSVRERKCFLCADNLPPEQRGLPCDGDYVVLCNPFPIFPEHFTLASLHHTPQLIRDSFGAFLQSTRELGTRYTVFYNGPRCGASAPDHLHFQAGNRSFLPIDGEYAAIKARYGHALLDRSSLHAWSAGGFLRPCFGLESADAGLLRRAFDALYAVLQEGAPQGEEPMLNVLGFHTNGEWQVLVFPRAKHRPSFYFNEGDAKLLISPAAVELGGICTTPREQDFERVTREHIFQLYGEVCIAPDKCAAISDSLASKLAGVR
jgi:hypothetical protein